MKAIWLSLLIIIPLTGTSMAATSAYKEGEAYMVLKQPQPTVDSSKVEVVELFWYGCPHCHSFQPYVEDWLKTNPANVAYVRMPAILREDWSLHARAFYTAELLGILDEIHQPLFNAIHNEKRHLFSEKALMNFFAEFGVDNDTFNNTMHSFAVDTKVRRARQMTRNYMTRGTPAVVVNGKYRTGPGMVKGYDNLIDVIDFLVKKESATK